MTVSQLRQQLTDDEFIHFAAYYEIKGKREQAKLRSPGAGRLSP